MKIAVAQINTTVGDFEGNSAKIIDRIKWATSNKADLVVFPEMTVTGYPPKDLLDKPHFVSQNLEKLNEIAIHTDSNIAAVVGFISVNEATTGKGLFNSAAFLYEGVVRHIEHKSLLPTYDVFDEGRYFEPGNIFELVELKGKKIGITICEDIWSRATVYGRKLYTVDPVGELVKKGAEFIVNISASPYVVNKHATRKKLISNVSRNNKLPVVYVNLVGGSDELIFDGRSMVFDEKGEVVIEGGAFVEDGFIVDIDELPKYPAVHNLTKVEEVFKALILGVRDYISKCNFQKVVIGLSGGIDSALVACLAAEAIGAENVMGIWMPTRFASQESIDLANELAKRLGIAFNVVDIDKIFEVYLKTLEPHFKGKEFDVAEENIQARIRGNILMAFSNKFGAIVLSAGNKSELAVGYCTLYGDLAGGLAVISDVPKTLVYELSKFVNRDQEIIPSRIIERPPSAELKPDQIDQDSLPPYDVLDAILKAYIEDHHSIDSIVEVGFDRAVVEDVAAMVRSSEYKRRQVPPGLKVTSKAFGWGRRFPIACK